MENISDIELIYLNNTELNVYKKAHITFYSIQDNKINFLLIKDKKPNSKYSQISTAVLGQDNTATFSIARILSCNFLSLFNDENINKILNQTDLLKTDIIDDRHYYYHELWELKNYFYWLEKLSDKPIIQYDCIKDHQFYFYELPNFSNLDKLNRNLNDLGYPYDLKYFSSEDFIKNVTSVSDEINNSTVNIFNTLKFEEHIRNTQKNIDENKLDKFYILSIKPAEGTKQDQAGFFHFPALFQGIYRKNTENWIYLVCSLDTLPKDEDLVNAKAILIPGSHISVYNDYQFLRKTEEWLKNFYLHHEKVKFLGICFGMQIFLKALGGNIEKMNHVSFVRGPTKIDLKKKFWDFEFIKKSGVEKTDALYIMEAHGDECTFIPEEVKIQNYGKSDSCFNEILVCDNERILLIQGHPEYHPIFNIERMVPFYLMRENKEKTLENILELKEKFSNDMNSKEIHSLEYRKICNSFLKN